MLPRALIVVLLVLNLGVALWWIARPALPAGSPPVSDRGGIPLQLVRPGPVAASPVQDPQTRAVGDDAAAAPSAAADVQCLRLGPFSARNVAEALRGELGERVGAGAIEEVPGEATSYRVLLPPAGDRAQAQATVERIAAAGFQDYLILNQGDDTHAIALGAFRGRDTAERRVAALQAAGFPAELRPQGNAAPSRWWLDVATSDAAAVKARVPRAQERDCARLR